MRSNPVLRVDGMQPRVALDNDDGATEYAEAIRDGASMPPVVAFHDGSH